MRGEAGLGTTYRALKSPHNRNKSRARGANHKIGAKVTIRYIRAKLG
jgi:hypothetical protein